MTMRASDRRKAAVMETSEKQSEQRRNAKEKRMDHGKTKNNYKKLTKRKDNRHTHKSTHKHLANSSYVISLYACLILCCCPPFLSPPLLFLLLFFFGGTTTTLSKMLASASAPLPLSPSARPPFFVPFLLLYSFPA